MSGAEKDFSSGYGEHWDGLMRHLTEGIVRRAMEQNMSEARSAINPNMQQAYDIGSGERGATFRLRCLELAAGYCGRTGPGDPVEMARRFEAYILNSPASPAIAAPAASADTGGMSQRQNSN
jgi:hypothetical protein